MTADLPEPLDGPEYADVAARVLGGWNAGLTGTDHAARLVATVEATRRVVDAAIARAEKAEADYAICFEEWGKSVRAAGERGAELFIRANEAEIRAQAADVLRVRLAEIGEPIETEVRFVLADGSESEFDLHNGPCDCEKQARDLYAGPWRAEA